MTKIDPPSPPILPVGRKGRHHAPFPLHSKIFLATTTLAVILGLFLVNLEGGGSGSGIRPGAGDRTLDADFREPAACEAPVLIRSGSNC